MKISNLTKIANSSIQVTEMFQLFLPRKDVFLNDLNDQLY